MQMNPASKSSLPAVLDPVVAAVMEQLEEQVEAKNSYLGRSSHRGEGSDVGRG